MTLVRDKNGQMVPLDELRQEMIFPKWVKKLPSFLMGIGKFIAIRAGCLKHTEIEDIDLNIIRYKPVSLEALTKRTRFTRRELQIMYRGFKQECPTGLVNETTFREIYSQFFPQGDATMYAHYVFNTFDVDRTGQLSFEQFINGLSLLTKGTLDDKLSWVFRLYDMNCDNVITKSELLAIVTSIYDLLGKCTDPILDERSPKSHVDYIFEKMDLDQDGVISHDEFMAACHQDPTIFSSMEVLNTIICFD